MIVIIDGCDKAGKSTVIEKLKNKVDHGLMLKNLDKPKDGTNSSQLTIKDHYEEMAVLMKSNPYFIYVLDRWYPTELVYSSIKRGYDSFGDKFYKQFDRKMAKEPNLYVWIDADPNLIKKRFISDGEDFAKAEEVDKIRERYQFFFDKTSLNKTRVDTTNDLEGAINFIVSCINRVDHNNITDGREYTHEHK